MAEITVNFKVVGTSMERPSNIELKFEQGAKMGEAMSQLLDICGEPLREFYDEATGKNYLTFILQGKTLDAAYELQDGNMITIFPICEGG